LYQFNIISTKEVEEDAKLFSNLSAPCSLLLVRKEGFDIEDQEDIDFICKLLSPFEYEVSTESTFYVLTKDIVKIKETMAVAGAELNPNMTL